MDLGRLQPSRRSHTRQLFHLRFIGLKQVAIGCVNSYHSHHVSHFGLAVLVGLPVFCNQQSSVDFSNCHLLVGELYKEKHRLCEETGKRDFWSAAWKFDTLIQFSHTLEVKFCFLILGDLVQATNLHWEAQATGASSWLGLATVSWLFLSVRSLSGPFRLSRPSLCWAILGWEQTVSSWSALSCPPQLACSSGSVSEIGNKKNTIKRKGESDSWACTASFLWSVLKKESVSASNAISGIWNTSLHLSQKPNTCTTKGSQLVLQCPSRHSHLRQLLGLTVPRNRAKLIDW